MKTPLEQAEEWVKKGNAHDLLSQLKEALAAYKRAIEIDPGDTDAEERMKTMLFIVCQKKRKT
ncbi:tetratricopeptide repeat protein [Methanoplanus sp. FWC-SCC4]|uniref:Tetratricopeptide repeat protein n=1 Tax=Methanochimaera problematica TaxID=2609417 RepID=A0AA97FBT8_9EURY|nr:tetratricopeptide repeat protein [Methanoplanus sp. FWC-SCC4]WOF15173.1 tetratricopeptide repeat protein [Methanoplanus sp. FWC-SCC4]